MRAARLSLASVLPRAELSMPASLLSILSRYRSDVLSGLTVALALVPEAVAFAFVAGVHPLVGLYAAILVGLVTAALGGRPGMISGATGALAVVIVSLVATHGVQYLFATVVLMGVLQMAAGFLGLGKFIRLVPRPVMLGFVNGLAIVIFLAQLRQFGVAGQPGWLADTSLKGSIIDIAWLPSGALWTMVTLVGLTMAIIEFFPRVTKSVPAPLVAILAVSAIVIGGDIHTSTVGDMAKIAGTLPSFSLPDVPFSFDTLSVIFPYAAVMAAVGLLESLLTLQVVDELTETRGHGNRECVAQGLANLITGFFGGMGGCAMIGQSMINVNSGGRGRLSGISAALFLLVFMLFAAQYIEMIPLAALVGVMFMVVVGTFEWASFGYLRKVPKMDAFVLILVSGITVATDLAFAVLVGVIVSALGFAWNHAKHVTATALVLPDGQKCYMMHGPLFFGSVASLADNFEPAQDPAEVVLDFAQSRVCDHSALRAIEALAERYQRYGKRIRIRHIGPDCRQVLSRSGIAVEVD